MINELPPSSYRTCWFLNSFNFLNRFGCIKSLFEVRTMKLPFIMEIEGLSSIWYSNECQTNRLVKGTHCCSFVPHIVSISVFHFVFRYSASIGVITEKYVRGAWIVGRWEEIRDENACMHFIKHSFVVQDVRNRISNNESARCCVSHSFTLTQQLVIFPTIYSSTWHFFSKYPNTQWIFFFLLFIVVVCLEFGRIQRNVRFLAT